jgi:crotonobetainyl-CoA:carnitine CoA-transferase CaiB-like acyl-CoA transferase
MLALEGIKVIDFTTWIFAAGATAILADLGADVIKVEDPATGDPQRAIIMFGGGTQIPEINFPWELENRGKRGMGIDLRTDQGRKIMYKLVEQSDVFVSNIRADVLQNLGVDYDTMSKINPKLIYAHGSGYGVNGPEALRPGFDYAAFWARGGIMNMVGEPDAPPPQCLPGYGDNTSAMAMAAGIAFALFVRERTGMGQRVDISLLGTALWCNGLSVTGAGFTEEETLRVSRKTVPNPLFNSYKCKDGRWLMLACLQSDRFWSDFCGVMGLNHLEHDPKYENMFVRAVDPAPFIALLDDLFIAKDRDEWGRLFDEKEIIWAPIQTLKEALNDPQAVANEFVSEVIHPEHGPFRLISIPIKLRKTPASIRTIAPELGQHTEEILIEMGYTWDDITAFKEAKAIT